MHLKSCSLAHFVSINLTWLNLAPCSSISTKHVITILLAKPLSSQVIITPYFQLKCNPATANPISSKQSDRLNYNLGARTVYTILTRTVK